jgi:putative peptidoglycan lipid II flippase
MMISLLLSRVLGIVRDIVMTYMFGGNANTDAYRLAFQIPDLLFFLIAGGALSSAFIPVFSEYLHTDKEEEAWHIFSVVTTVMSLIVGGFIVVAWIFAPQLSHVVAPGKPDELLPLISYMSRIVLPAQFAFFIGGLMFGTLYARQVFTVPGLGPNVYNIGMIFGAVVISHFVTPGVVGMSWGALVGAVIGNLVIPYFVMAKLGMQFKPSLDTRHPGVRKVFKLMLPVVLGLSLPGVYALIMQGFGSYYPDGVNTYLDLSNRLMQAPLGIFGQSLAIAVFPALTQFFAQNRMDLYRTQLASTMRTVVYLTLPISAIMLAMSHQIVAALYEGGKFGATQTSAVAACLQLFAVGVFAWCLHPVLMRGFFAVQNSVTPILLGTATTVVFVTLVFILKATPLGFYALPAASSISAVLLVMMLTIAVSKRIGGLDIRSILVTFGKSLVASVPVGLVAYGVSLVPLRDVTRRGLSLFGLHIGASASHKVATVAVVLLTCIVVGWVYYFITKSLKMEETAYVTRALNRLNRRKTPVTPIEAGND